MKHGRRFVIGDIHGNLRALKQVIERAGIKPEDTLIFLGDYVDRHPESAQVLEYIRGLFCKTICIIGNHDEWLREWLEENGIPKSVWFNQGGESTIKSYMNIEGEALRSVTKSVHLEFLNNMPYYYIDEDNNLYLHAGFTHPDGVKHEEQNSMFYWDRSLWKSAMATKNMANLIPQLQHYKEVFVGHTTTMMWKETKPMQAHNMWNLDTGGGFNGHITIMDVVTKEYWQSDNVEGFYTSDVPAFDLNYKKRK